MEKRAQEVEEQRRNQEAERQAAKTFFSISVNEPVKSKSIDKELDRKNNNDRRNKRRVDSDWNESKKQDRYNEDAPTKDSLAISDISIEQEELQAIRVSFLNNHNLLLESSYGFR